MPIKKFDNTVAGKALALDVPDPKYIIEGPHITVFTGADIPPDTAVANPSSIVLTTHQLHAGALAVGQTRLDQLTALIETPPTPAIGLYLGMSQQIARASSKVNQARQSLGWTNALMDQVFVAGSGMDP